MSLSKIPYLCGPHIYAVFLFSRHLYFIEEKKSICDGEKSPLIWQACLLDRPSRIDRVIKQRIEDQAADTLSLRKTKVDLAVEEG